MKYSLVNPKIDGTFGSTVEASSPDNAVQTLWDSLSEHIVGNVPSIMVTLQEGGNSGSLHHYKIKESVDEDKNAHISYDKISVKLSKSDEQNFVKQLNKLTTQHGGDKKKRKRYKGSNDDDDSSDSDSDSDNYYVFKKRRPVKFLWYTPYIYSRNAHVNVTIPTIRPFVYTRIWTPRITVLP